MVVGITGNTGSGKTTVSKILEKNGFLVIDCDILARKVVEFPKCMEELKLNFGEDIYENEILNRKRLGEIVFQNEDKLKKLNGITHKYIIDEIYNIIEKNKDKNILIDAPLLFEARLEGICSKVIGVIADEKTKIDRIVKRDNIDFCTAYDRLKNQKSNDFFIKNCDFIINNNFDSLSNLEINVLNLVSKL